MTCKQLKRGCGGRGRRWRKQTPPPGSGCLCRCSPKAPLVEGVSHQKNCAGGIRLPAGWSWEAREICLQPLGVKGICLLSGQRVGPLSSYWGLQLPFCWSPRLPCNTGERAMGGGKGVFLPLLAMSLDMRSTFPVVSTCTRGEASSPRTQFSTGLSLSCGFCRLFLGPSALFSGEVVISVPLGKEVLDFTSFFCLNVPCFPEST